MSEWISVKDRLPDFYVPVLTVSVDVNSTPIVSKLHEGKEGCTAFITAYGFYGERKIGFHFETYPTHWMPLPKPPQEYEE